MYFEYGEKELAVLRRDKRMCEVIDRVGHIYRDVDGDIFSSVVHHIIGQQISTKAQATVWQRMRDDLGEVNAETILAAGVPVSYTHLDVYKRQVLLLQIATFRLAKDTVC